MNKKTIVLKIKEGEQIAVLESVMRGALSYIFVISKYTKVFDSRKEAEETIKNHPAKPRNKDIKYLTLNDTQSRAIEYLKTRKGYIKINDFLSLK